MFTITTATGKQFQCDYAVIAPQNDMAFVRVLGLTLEEAMGVFSDLSELPLDIYPQFHHVTGYLDEGDAIKIVLKP